jgi:hypothetical protein
MDVTRSLGVAQYAVERVVHAKDRQHGTIKMSFIYLYLGAGGGPFEYRKQRAIETA